MATTYPEPRPPEVPTVLCIAGLDPTGGAGLQADIEAVASMGGHALPLLTASTAQDTVDVTGVTPVSAADFVAQGRILLDDISPRAVKIGLLGSVEIASATASLLDACPRVPVVFDPICSSGSGTPVASDELLDLMVSLLLPRTTVLTPNTLEARLLTPESDTLSASAQQLLSYGCEYVLLTGTHEASEQVEHQLYGGMRLQESYRFARLPGDYHGSGCTLSAALAALLAHGVEPLAACSKALEYTWSSLAAAYTLGRGQRLPNRMHWSSRSRA